MKAPNLRLLFFGSDRFSQIVLKHFVDNRICRLGVVTREGSFLDQYSEENHLETHSWPIESKIWTRDEYNIGLVASFGQLISPNTVNQFKFGLFNVHPSLLPQYRGSSPIQAAILDGQSQTGCTIMRIPPIPKFDVGDIVIQERLEIKTGEYAVSLRDRLARLGANLAEDLFVNYENRIKEIRPQGEEGKSYAKKLRPEQGLISFRTESSDLICRKIRAYTGFIEVFTFCKNGLKIRLEDMVDPREVEALKIERLAFELMFVKSSKDHTVKPGTIYMHKVRQLLCIRCKDEKWLAFRSIVPEMKSKKTAADFYNGYLSGMHVDARLTDV